MTLRLAPDLIVPIDAVTETFAILGKRGSGKTTTARVLAEELLDAQMPVVILDPTGVWWGLRSSADGAGEGYPVVIFGGDHADVPLTETSGVIIADAIVDQRASAVLDLSTLSKSATRRFAADFIERLYHRNRQALHVIIDEADLFAPQRTVRGGERLLGAVNDLQRRGRVRGLGTTLITQRPAVLSKDVLTQAEVLVALRMVGVRDVAAIDEWVRLHADEDEARTLKASLPSLPVGAAWVWSPGWLEVLQQVQIRLPRTFDSSATPKPGEARILPRRMTEVDLTALREQIEAESPPKRPTSPARPSSVARPAPVQQVVERVEVPVVTPEDAARWDKRVQVVEEGIGQAVAALTELGREVKGLREEVQALRSRTSLGTPRSKGVSIPVPATTVTDDSTRLPRAQRMILTVLAQHGSRSVTQVAILAGYSGKSGGYRNALSALRTAGYIEGRGEISLTQAGADALGEVDPLPTGQALRQWWQETHLGRAERVILDVLAEDHPSAVPTIEIAGRTGYSAASGGFRNALSRLRSLELAFGRGELTINPELMD